MNNTPQQDTPPGEEPSILEDYQDFDPWWRIWYQPRRTFAYLIAVDPKMHFWLLTSFYGITGAIGLAIATTMGDKFSPSEVALFILVMGTFFGFFEVFFTGSLLRLVGRFFGGIAESQHVRAVLAWAAVPRNVLTIISLLPLVGMFGTDIFTSTNLQLEQLLMGEVLGVDLVGTTLFLWYTALSLVGGFYYIVLVVLGFSEVEKINIWKSIGVFVIVYGGLILTMSICLTLNMIAQL